MVSKWEGTTICSVIRVQGAAVMALHEESKPALLVHGVRRSRRMICQMAETLQGAYRRFTHPGGYGFLFAAKLTG